MDLDGYLPFSHLPQELKAYRVKMCNNTSRGSCFHGDRCMFAHDQSQVRAFGKGPTIAEILAGGIRLPRGVSVTGDFKRMRQLDVDNQLDWTSSEDGDDSSSEAAESDHGPSTSAAAETNVNGFPNLPIQLVPSKLRAFKVQMCRNGMACFRLDACDYAHKQSEQRNYGTGPSLQEARARGLQLPPQLVALWQQHEAQQRAATAAAAASSSTVAYTVQRPKPPPGLLPQHLNLWRTNMCKDGASCRFKSVACKFAHSPAELRPPGTGPDLQEALEFSNCPPDLLDWLLNQPAPATAQPSPARAPAAPTARTPPPPPPPAAAAAPAAPQPPPPREQDPHEAELQIFTARALSLQDSLRRSAANLAAVEAGAQEVRAEVAKVKEKLCELAQERDDLELALSIKSSVSEFRS